MHQMTEAIFSAGTAFLDVGTRKMHVKDDVPKKMAGSTLHQPGRTKPLASSAPSTTATFAPYVKTEGETMRPPPFISDAITHAHSKSSRPSTSKFKPFRDKLDNISPVMSKPAAEAVMKVKQEDTKEPIPMSEAHK
ncbi:hypothetical protein B0H11DRAFT_2223653 [Mycena galericulata]|nr:hypothetical protein B0H11DRAFT_2223653 [Mycena galericulata]